MRVQSQAMPFFLPFCHWYFSQQPHFTGVGGEPHRTDGQTVGVWVRCAIWGEILRGRRQESGLERIFTSRATMEPKAKFIDLFGEYIKRSGALGISVRISRQRCLDLYLEHPDLPQVAEIINSCVPRCVSLELKLPVQVLRLLFDDLPPISSPILRQLTFAGLMVTFDGEENYYRTNGRFEYLDLTLVTGALEVLDLNAGRSMLSLKNVKVDSSNLTWVSCGNTYALITSLICEAPRLQTAILEISGPRISHDEQPSVHESLQHLELICGGSGVHSFMSTSSFPNLDTLCIEEFEEPTTLSPHIVVGFILQSGKFLRRMILDVPHGVAPDVGHACAFTLFRGADLPRVMPNLDFSSRTGCLPRFP